MLELYKKENSARLIFVHKVTRENILTAKITQTTVQRKIELKWYSKLLEYVE